MIIKTDEECVNAVQQLCDVALKQEGKTTNLLNFHNGTSWGAV